MVKCKVLTPVFKKLSLSVEGQLRINGNGKYFDESYYNQSFYEIETKYKLSKRFDIGLAYRGINKYDDQGNSQGAMHSKGFIHLLSMVKTLIGSELNQGFSIKSGVKEK